MENKNKVWIIILIILLIGAIAGLVILNNSAASKQIALNDALAQLEEVKGNTDALTDQLAQAQSTNEVLSAELIEARTTPVATDTPVPTDDPVVYLQGQVAQLTEELTASRVRVAELEEMVKENADQVTDIPAADPTAAEIAGTDTVSILPDESVAENKTEATTGKEAEPVVEAAGVQEMTALQAELASVTAERDASAVELETAKTELAAVSTQLETALTELTEANAQLETVQTELTEANAQLETTQTELTASNAQLETTQTELTASNAQVETTQAELSAMSTELESVKTDLAATKADLIEKEAALQSSNEELEAAQSDISDKEASLTETQNALEVAEAEIAVLQDVLSSTQTELQNKTDEAEAYKLDRVLEDGEGTDAALVEDMILVDADGTTAHWSYTNDSISGNDAKIEIMIGDETVYTSGKVIPGQNIKDIQMSKQLEPGTYEAMSVTTTYDNEGSVITVTRIPITVTVG